MVSITQSPQNEVLKEKRGAAMSAVASPNLTDHSGVKIQTGRDFVVTLKETKSEMLENQD